jgi:hypothetical protein
VEGMAVSSFYIPVSKPVHDTLQYSYAHYCACSPHDYAFIGMRCAASAYWMLSRAGIFEPANRRRSIIHSFHPKMLRKKMVKLSQKNHWKVSGQEGNAGRKWEGY